MVCDLNIYVLSIVLPKKASINVLSFCVCVCDLGTVAFCAGEKGIFLLFSPPCFYGKSFQRLVLLSL